MSLPPSQRRIALLIHALYGGGAERLMSELAARWAADHEVHLITWATCDTDQYPLPAGVHRHGLDLMRSSNNLLQGIRANLRRVHVLRQKLKDVQPDLILSFADQMNTVTLQAALPLGIPTWISEHSDPAQQKLSFLWEKWRQSVYRRCTGCVVLTQGIARTMAAWVPESRIRVIPPAISSVPNSGPASASPTAGPKTALFVGRLSPEKGLPNLIESWKQKLAQLPDWRLQLVGDGNQRQELEDLAGQIPSIQFLGWCSDPSPYYRAADLFVLPSEYEGFPVALLEAMSYGLPCLTTRCSGAIDDLLAEGAPIQTVPVGMPQALAEALYELANSPERRLEMSKASKQVAQRYQWERIGKLWDALLSDSSPAKPAL